MNIDKVANDLLIVAMEKREEKQRRKIIRDAKKEAKIIYKFIKSSQIIDKNICGNMKDAYYFEYKNCVYGDVEIKHVAGNKNGFYLLFKEDKQENLKALKIDYKEFLKIKLLGFRRQQKNIKNNSIDFYIQDSKILKNVHREQDLTA